MPPSLQNAAAGFMSSPLMGRSASGRFQMSPLLLGSSPAFGGKATPPSGKSSKTDRQALQVSGGIAPLSLRHVRPLRSSRHACIVLLLQGALRREEVAAAEIARCKGQLVEMGNLLSVKDKDIQRLNMIIRLREGKIKRLEGAAPPLEAQEESALLAQELTLWKEKAEHHPEVTRFAMENLKLKEAAEELRKFVEAGGEREALLEDLAVLRTKTLELLENEHEVEDAEAVVARVAAASAAQIEEAAAQAHASAVNHEQASAALQSALADKAAMSQAADGARADADKLREELWALRAELEDRNVELLDIKVAADEAGQRTARKMAALEEELSREQDSVGMLTAEVGALQRALEVSRSDAAARLEAASAEAAASMDDLRVQLSQLHVELQDKSVLEASLVHAEQCANAMQAELDSILQV